MASICGRLDISVCLYGTCSAARVEQIIEYAKAKNRKSICIVTGVPGAGKTLAGLNIATSRSQRHSDEHAVFLSGNGPLVDVLREALARDRSGPANLNSVISGNSKHSADPRTGWRGVFGGQEISTARTPQTHAETYLAGDDASDDSDGARALKRLQAAACIYRIAYGPRAGQKVLSLQGAKPRAADFKQRLCANLEGFSLHAAVRCAAHERKSLERLCRYITRPAIAHEPASAAQLGAATQAGL